MKVIAIDIDKAKVIFCVLEMDLMGNIISEKNELNFVTLGDDKDSLLINAFKKSIHSFFGSIKPDKIVILSRQMKGRFKAASVSFKIEALIQTYHPVCVTFMAPQTLKAYYKKHDFEMLLDYAFQEDAMKLGYYILALEEAK